MHRHTHTHYYLCSLCLLHVCCNNFTACLSNSTHIIASPPLPSSPLPSPPLPSPPLPSPPLPSSPLHRFYGSRFDDIFNIVPVGNSFNDSLNATAVGCRSHLTLCLWAKSWWCLHGRGQHIPWAVCVCFLQQITISYLTAHPTSSPFILTSSLVLHISPLLFTFHPRTSSHYADITPPSPPITPSLCPSPPSPRSV